ncbi:MAG: DUF1292 domain-containing protein [Clostridium sp.]|nr:DUF1292 domain-containing protein [Clostridium sp.]MCM1398192.1 DUF1292 domain-containing protein [Clostridium sp.]MCM1460394.1 DUF1292 domain-containing protein [Bacteroides sp.]
MEDGKLIFETEDGNVEFFVLEQTTLGGINYILVTEDIDSEEGDFLILKENSGEGDIASYEVMENENEIKAVAAIFNELLDDIDLEV